MFTFYMKIQIKIFTDLGQAILTETGDFELIAYDGCKYQKSSKKVNSSWFW